MRPIRVACLAGFAAMLVGALLLALASLIGPQAGGAVGAVQVILSLAGLLLASGGLFLCACAAAVLAASYLSRPRLSSRS